PAAVAATIPPADPVAPWLPRRPTPRAHAAFAAHLARAGRWQDAADVVAAGVPAEPPVVADFDALAAAFHHAGQWGLEAALRSRRLSIHSSPDAHAAAAAAWARLQAWDPALLHARIAVRSDPANPDWQARLGDILDAKGETMEAIAALTEAVRLRPNDTALRLKRAGVYRSAKMYGFAVDDYREVVKQAPRSREGAMGLAGALAESGNRVEALAAIETWVEAHPQDDGARQARDRMK
ncbi:MAG: tetratricopeptide repeat protein, partial [Planctomycetia bacterium]|nr:tetratricopeptide repeat protein [Planctomycetia bacterium]